VGQDPNKVKPLLAALLDAAGADLPDAELAAWSTAIAQDRPFEIRLT